MPWLLVANPTARSGQGAERLDGAVQALAQVGIAAELLPTRPHGATAGAVSEALSRRAYSGVIAMGGDGTFHEVANGLLRTGLDLPLAVLPTGTGNNQARSLGLPLDDLAAAAAIVAAGRTAAMDGARITAHDVRGVALDPVWAFDSVGFGFSARALHFRFEDKAAVAASALLRDLYRDELVYAGAAARALVASYFEDHRFDARVTTELGETHHEDLHDLIVNNTRFYARAWVLDPHARHDDGRMELLPIHGMDEWAAHAIVTLDGNPLRDWLDAAPATQSASHFDIEIVARSDEPPVPAQVDGEPWPSLARVRMEVARGVLRVVVPAGEPEPVASYGGVLPY